MRANTKRFRPFLLGSALAAGALASAGASAAQWNDVTLGWSVGNRYREPYNPEPIHKNVLSLTWASGYRIGNQFLNVDVLKSGHNDPASAHTRRGAVETYVTYRYTFDLGKLTDRDFAAGPVRGLGVVTGFDWNMKHDAGYNSRKRMLVVGPQLMWDVPGGRFNTAVLMAWESNAPSGPFPPVSGVHGRYHYDAHPMLAMDWSVPFGPRWTFSGFANWIGAKGRDETGHVTGAETLIDVRLMGDAGALAGLRKGALQVGLRYQYWRNKFGNTRATTNGKGYIASTPMLQVDYRF